MDRRVWGPILAGAVATVGVLIGVASPATAAVGWDQVSAGFGHSCGITSGRLYCWGRDSSGQLGNGAAESDLVSSPQQITAFTNWTTVAASNGHTCGVRGGKLYCWGLDDDGQLGNGDDNGSATSPIQVGSDSGWTSVSARRNTTCGIRDGELFCWGQDDFGQVGNGNESIDDVTSPEPVGGTAAWTEVSVGGTHVCGLRAGKLFCWGFDLFGQVGNGNESSDPVTAPTRIGDAITWTSVAVGDAHTCGIRAGKLFCWGNDGNGQVGDGEELTPEATAPVRIGTATTWTNVAAGDSHSCGIQAGTLLCWGGDAAGQLGNGDPDGLVYTPIAIGSAAGWTNVTAAEQHTCGIRGGKVFCWGGDAFQQLGDGDINTGAIAPVLVAANTPASVPVGWGRVAAGGGHTCGIVGGRLSCWGNDTFGQLGNGADGPMGSPQQVTARADWTRVAAAAGHTCGIAGGNLFCWGYDLHGQVGNGSGSSDNVTSPMMIGADTGWTRVAAGMFHTCGIQAGKLFCWGRDDFGQLGNGDASADDVAAPAQVGIANTWTSVAAGIRNTCGIQAGKLFCWGHDDHGQVGNGDLTSIDMTTPAQVGTASTWSTVSVGYNHTCATRAGKLFCWGNDDRGQLGNGDPIDPVTAPLRIGLATTWAGVTAGDSHTCATRAAKLFCWGNDFKGQAGNGDATNEHVLAPQQVAGTATSWTAVNAGTSHTCGTQGAKLFCWGEDDYGQIGNSDTTGNVTSPTRIG